MGRLVLTPSLRVAEIAESEATTGEADPNQTDEDVPEVRNSDAVPPWSDPQATLYEAADARPVPEPVDAAPDEADFLEPEESQPAGVVGETGAMAHDDADGNGEKDSEGASLGPTVEALETAIGETPDQWEPDGEGGDDYAGTPVRTLEWEDHEAAVPRDDAAAEVSPQEADVAAEPEDARNPANLDPLETEDTILDEESLRELVTDIVREELQGALGERITRNVRKLVRREIHRALTAQELE